MPRHYPNAAPDADDEREASEQEDASADVRREFARRPRECEGCLRPMPGTHSRDCPEQ